MQNLALFRRPLAGDHVFWPALPVYLTLNLPLSAYFSDDPPPWGRLIPRYAALACCLCLGHCSARWPVHLCIAHISATSTELAECDAFTARNCLNPKGKQAEYLARVHDGPSAWGKEDQLVAPGGVRQRRDWPRGNNVAARAEACQAKDGKPAWDLVSATALAAILYLSTARALRVRTRSKNWLKTLVIVTFYALSVFMGHFCSPSLIAHPTRGGGAAGGRPFMRTLAWHAVPPTVPRMLALHLMAATSAIPLPEADPLPSGATTALRFEQNAPTQPGFARHFVNASEEAIVDLACPPGVHLSTSLSFPSHCSSPPYSSGGLCGPIVADPDQLLTSPALGALACCSHLLNLLLLPSPSSTSSTCHSGHSPRMTGRKALYISSRPPALEPAGAGGEIRRLIKTSSFHSFFGVHHQDNVLFRYIFLADATSASVSSPSAQ
ncbi:hypothetical protein TYRP_023300 [Tyrophagus putrescentiae]|nr:hypothetical protein TYRP_023300 [Tyrophagus putrescentiae]